MSGFGAPGIYGGACLDRAELERRAALPKPHYTDAGYHKWREARLTLGMETLELSVHPEAVKMRKRYAAGNWHRSKGTI